MDTALRPMSTSQVLDRTFFLYRNNFLVFAGIAMVAPLLTLMAAMVQLAVLGRPVMPQPGALDPTAIQNVLARSLISAVLGLVCYAVGSVIATGATIHAVSMLHLGKTVTIVESYRSIKPVFWRILSLLVRIFFFALWPILVGYVLLLAMIFSFAAIAKQSPGAFSPLLIVLPLFAFLSIFGGAFWAVFVYCRYSLAIAACTIEKLPVRDSMKRSAFLTRGSMWRVVGIYLLTLLMSWVLASLFQAPSFFFFNPFSPKAGAISSAYLIWSYLGNFLGTTAAGPIATIALALVYYDQRVRKEAFDLQLMMDAMAQQQAPPAEPTTSAAMG